MFPGVMQGTTAPEEREQTGALSPLVRELSSLQACELGIRKFVN